MVDYKFGNLWLKEFSNIKMELTEIVDELRNFLEQQGIEEDTDLYLPPLDAFETEDEYILNVEVPGSEPDSFRIEFSQNILTIQGRKKSGPCEGTPKYYLMERQVGAFKRVISIPAPINARGIKAVYTNGILAITLPKIKDRRGSVAKINVIVEE